MNAPENEPTVTMFNEHQLADRWNMSVRTLQDWRHKKTGPKYIKFKGWSVRYPLDAVVEYEGKWLCEVTYLRRGIAANPYIAEGLTGRTVLSEHLYWHASHVHGPEWAVDYLDSAACDWTPEEIDFVDWVFNASPVLKERAEMMALHEGMTYERDPEKRAPYAQRSLDFIDRITDTQSKKMMRKVQNRWGDDIWPWGREGFHCHSMIQDDVAESIVNHHKVLKKN